MRNKELYDFRALGQAIKAARLKQGLTRYEAAEKIHIDPRYLTNIENKGQCPSLHIFYKLVILFNISVDQFFFPDTAFDKSARRRQLDNILDNLDESDLIIIKATANGIKQAKEETET